VYAVHLVVQLGVIASCTHHLWILPIQVETPQPPLTHEVMTFLIVFTGDVFESGVSALIADSRLPYAYWHEKLLILHSARQYP
jgi:hypothetical protein